MTFSDGKKTYYAEMRLGGEWSSFYSVNTEAEAKWLIGDIHRLNNPPRPVLERIVG